MICFDIWLKEEAMDILFTLGIYSFLDVRTILFFLFRAEECGLILLLLILFVGNKKNRGKTIAEKSGHRTAWSDTAVLKGQDHTPAERETAIRRKAEIERQSLEKSEITTMARE